LTTKPADPQIRHFIEAYTKSKKATLTPLANEVFAVSYPDKPAPEEYTYNAAVAREKKIPLIAPGSPTFQRIMHECLSSGVLCQVQLSPKDGYEALLKSRFREDTFACIDCDKVHVGDEVVSVCVKPSPCVHRVNNAKICSALVQKKEPLRFYQFYFSVVFQNKLRAKSEEILTLMLDEKGGVVQVAEFGDTTPLADEGLVFEDFKSKIKADVFDKLKATAEERLNGLIREQLMLYDLPLQKEKAAKLHSFGKRLKRERRERLISKKLSLDFDYQKWQANYQALLAREEESCLTHVTVKLLNLLVINTSKVKFEVGFDNNATLQSSIILGINHDVEATCPICRKPFTEGYATADDLYVCGGCIRQSVDTGKLYSKKAALSHDELLKEYFESDVGFVCSVCGKKHSRLLEFKCSHDGSSVCINHYGVCDICGKVFSKLNLTYTDEFRRQLCPKHAKKTTMETA
jgi:hypothetical protein